MISIVIPVYRRQECVLALLGDIYRQQDVEFEVIVVDDHSPDDTAAVIKKAFPRANVLVNSANCGPAVTRNRGIRAAKGDIIVGFDSDVTLPEPDVLQKVEEAFGLQPEISGLAFRILQPDGESDDVPRWWHPVPVAEFAPKRFLTSYFSGTACAFRREDIMKAGLYPEILYMHYEEVELALRLLDGGGRILYDPSLRAVHHANPVSRRSEVKVFYKPRNQVLLALRCYPLGRGLRYLFPRTGYGMVKAVAGGHLPDFIRAMWSAARLAPACLRARKVIRPQTWREVAALRMGLPVAAAAVERGGPGVEFGEEPAEQLAN